VIKINLAPKVSELDSKKKAVEALHYSEAAPGLSAVKILCDSMNWTTSVKLYRTWRESFT
jgi:hypothetical protein